MKVCRYDEGNTPVFSCPYHGWSYATDGKLVGVPYYKDAYKETLDKSKWGLPEVPQMYNYKGSIWATWDKKAPPFLDYLGDMKMFLHSGRNLSRTGTEHACTFRCRTRRVGPHAAATQVHRLTLVTALSEYIGLSFLARFLSLRRCAINSIISTALLR